MPQNRCPLLFFTLNTLPFTCKRGLFEIDVQNTHKHKRSYQFENKVNLYVAQAPLAVWVILRNMTPTLFSPWLKTGAPDWTHNVTQCNQKMFSCYLKLSLNLFQNNNNCSSRCTKPGSHNTHPDPPPHPGNNTDPPTVATKPEPRSTLPEGAGHPPLVQLWRDPDQVPHVKHRRKSQNGRGRVRCRFSWNMCHRCDGRWDKTRFLPRTHGRVILVHMISGVGESRDIWAHVELHPIHLAFSQCNQNPMPIVDRILFSYKCDLCGLCPQKSWKSLRKGWNTNIRSIQLACYEFRYNPIPLPCIN